MNTRWHIWCEKCSSSLATERHGSILHHDDGSHTFVPTPQGSSNPDSEGDTP